MGSKNPAPCPRPHPETLTLLSYSCGSLALQMLPKRGMLLAPSLSEAISFPPFPSANLLGDHLGQATEILVLKTDLPSPSLQLVQVAWDMWPQRKPRHDGSRALLSLVFMWGKGSRQGATTVEGCSLRLKGRNPGV